MWHEYSVGAIRGKLIILLPLENSFLIFGRKLVNLHLNLCEIAFGIAFHILFDYSPSQLGRRNGMELRILFPGELHEPHYHS